MSDEFKNAGPPRLDTRAKSSGWKGPLTTPPTADPTPFDEEIAATEARLAAAVAKRERLQEALFVARDRLVQAGSNGSRPQAEEAVQQARRAYDVAADEEGRARVRLTSLGVVRSDWKRERALEELER